MYVQRDLENKINPFLQEKEIIAVIGPRQVGKTTLINNILDKLSNSKINRVSFDNPNILNLFEEDINSFIEKHVTGFDILFIDEVQYSKLSGKHLKFIYDSQDIKIFISGSSASELSIHSLKYLVGRILIFKLFPFSFNEFLKFKDVKLQKIYLEANFKETINLELNKLLKEFIIYGGYPKVVLAKTNEMKEIYLQNIYETYILKEIKEILNISEEKYLIKLMKYLSLQIGNIIQYDSASQASELNFEKVKEYLSILEKTYISKLISTYHTNKTTELVKAPKNFFFDSGFRNVILNNFQEERQDIGELFENFIFSELIKNGFEPKYWRSKSKAEVDFIIEKNSKIIPIEVKYDLKQPKTTKSFLSFLERYSPDTSIITTLNLDLEIEKNNLKIKFIPFTKLIQNLN